MKKKIAILVALLIFIGLGMFILFNAFKKSQTRETKEIDSRLLTVRDAIDSSGYFKEAKYTYDENEMKVTVNEDYAVFVKASYYLMKIKNSSLEENYCKITDALNVTLGGNLGDSINTCMLTLEGKINLGSIQVETAGNTKSLTLKTDTKAILYNENNVHNSGDMISVDERNYLIRIGEYEFSNISVKERESAYAYDFCGNIYSNKKSATFNLKLFDDKKEKITDLTFNYEKKDDKYQNFCLEMKSDNQNVKYFSIEVD